MARYEHQMFFVIGYHSWNQEPVNIQRRKPGVLAGLTPLTLQTDPPISLLRGPNITHKHPQAPQVPGSPKPRGASWRSCASRDHWKIAGFTPMNFIIYIIYIYTVRHVYILEPQSEPPNCTMHSMYIHIHTYHIYIYRYTDDTHGCEIDEGEHYKNTPGKLLSCKHSKLLKKGPWGRRSWRGCSGSPPNPRFGFARSLWWCE